MEKILLLNSGVGHNLGDRAMLLNVVRQLRTRHPDWILMTHSHTPDFMVDEFGLRPVSFLIDCYARWSRLQTIFPSKLSQAFQWLAETILLFALVILLFACHLMRISLPRIAREGDFISSLLEADAIYFVGGGYLTDEGKRECRALLVTALLAALLGKPVLMSGQGLGPFHSRITRFMLTTIARRAKLISLRDSGRGKRLLAELGVPMANVETITDDALTLPAEPRRQRPHTLGIHWRNPPCRADTNDRVQAIMEEVIDSLASQGWSIRLFTFSEIPAHEKDIYSRWIAQREWPDVTLVENADPRELKSAIGECSVCLGVAYHFSVFALAAGVPLISLWHTPYYKDKQEGLLEAFGHPEWTLDDRKITSETLLARIFKQENSPRAHSNRRVAELAHRHATWQERIFETLENSIALRT